ncbi:MAG: DUF2961 domain-containing protein [Planctomycetota bacterium]|nr:DUF2961 domain-containing protein [Planctomycetota bacterium]
MHHLHCTVVSLAALFAGALGDHLAAQDKQHDPTPPRARGRSSDDFARLFPSRVKTFVKASYDPDDRTVAQSRGNDDGFSGLNLTESYRATEQGNPLAVLAHFEGRPGVLGLFFRDFWSDPIGQFYPGEDNRTSVWLDEQLTHDMPLKNYFRNPSEGQIWPFAGPFTGNRAGGHVTHTTMRWDDSFKLGLWDDGYHNASRFHRVAVTLGGPDGGAVPEANLQDWSRIANNRGEWPHRTARNAQTVNLTIAAGGSQSLSISGPGAIMEIGVQTTNHLDYRDLWARFYWDGEAQPSVNIPLRLLGGMLKPPFSSPVDGLMFHNDGDREMACYMPMPFAQGARLELHNEGNASINLALRTAVKQGAYPKPWGYFAAIYNSGMTGTEEPFLGPRLTNTRGILRGMMLETRTDDTGTIPEMHMTHLEGDLCVRINGTRGDDHTFAASETSIGRWGWYLTQADEPFVQDSSFQTGLQLRQMSNGHYEAMRLQGSTFVFDPISFVDGIEIVLEHGIQNSSNADYGLASFFYLEAGAARRTLAEIDIGNVSSELAHQAHYTQWTRYTRTGSFFRDQFFGTQPLSDSIRHIRDYLKFRVVRQLAGHTDRPIAVGFRLDRLGGPNTGICQAEIYVDGEYAGLMHSFTHSGVFPWKEGGECEVELPIALTEGKASFEVEVRPVDGTDPLRVAHVWIYEYLR